MHQRACNLNLASGSLVMAKSTVSKLTFDQYRRQLRQELHLQRVKDKDNSEARFVSDAKKLDAQLVNEGYKLIYPSEWGQDRNPSSLQPPVSGLNVESIGQGQLELMGAV